MFISDPHSSATLRPQQPGEFQHQQVRQIPIMHSGPAMGHMREGSVSSQSTEGSRRGPLRPQDEGWIADDRDKTPTPPTPTLPSGHYMRGGGNFQRYNSEPSPPLPPPPPEADFSAVQRLNAGGDSSHYSGSSIHQRIPSTVAPLASDGEPLYAAPSSRYSSKY